MNCGVVLPVFAFPFVSALGLPRGSGDADGVAFVPAMLAFSAHISRPTAIATVEDARK
jgi:hypothetical protein